MINTELFKEVSPKGNFRMDHEASLRDGRAPAELPALLRLGRSGSRAALSCCAALCHRHDPPAAVLALYH